MVKLLVTTLGFDEKFAIRAAFSMGLSSKDKVLIITAPLTYQTERALISLKEFFLNSLKVSEFRVLEINPLDFFHSIVKIINILSNLKADEIVVNLSGGMRAIILETFLALLALNKKVSFEIELENFSGKLSFTSNIIKALYSRKKLNLLRYIGNDWITVSSVIKRVSPLMSKSTIYYKLKKLEEMGLIEVKGLKRRKVRLSSLGRLIVEINKLMM